MCDTVWAACLSVCAPQYREINIQEGACVCVWLRAGRWAAAVKEQCVCYLIDAIRAYVGEFQLSTVIATVFCVSQDCSDFGMRHLGLRNELE